MVSTCDICEKPISKDYSGEIKIKFKDDLDKKVTVHEILCAGCAQKLYANLLIKQEGRMMDTEGI